MRIDLTNIKNIIFDLGNVLLRLDFDASIHAFQKIGLQKEVLDPKHTYADPVFYALEIGKVSTEEFRSTIRKILNNPDLSDRQIDDAWTAMILDIPANRVEMLRRLNKNYNVYLFSNTNQIHISKLHAEFALQHGIEFPSLFVKDYYSHEIHERKPDLSSYQKVIELSGINPNESLFIDDLEKNVVSARDAGLKAYLHNASDEIADLL